MKSLFKISKILKKNINQFSQVKKFRQNFLTPSNLTYIEAEYSRWLQDKNSVNVSFRTYFQLIERGVDLEAAFEEPPKLNEKLKIVEENQEITVALKTRLLIDAYRLYGHQFADIDPLNFPTKKYGALDRSILDPKNYGFTQEDLQKQIQAKETAGGLQQDLGKLKLKELIAYLEKIYCDKIGFQYMHLTDKAERTFLRSKFQDLNKITPTNQAKIATFERLCEDQSFTQFLGKKFANYKRFGVQGLNATTSALGQLVKVAAKNGTEYVVLGMAHRGRLNTLHCVFDKPAQIIFQQFLQKKKTSQNGSGDVKYHLGITHERVYDNNKITLSLVPNPSHLQAVNPLVYGRVRAIQDSIADNSRAKTLGVLIHGDAAIAGQGVVYESIQMQDLKDYTAGGIIHIVMNNQIGFTTDQIQSRSTFYCTQISKVVNAPVFHVNADEPDLLDKCIEIAYEYRQKFHKDIFIDIVGYRKYGHNEQDQPFFTQPLMYEKIKQMQPVYEKYVKKLISQNVLSQAKINQIKTNYMKKYEEAYKLAIQNEALKTKWLVKEFQQISPCKLWGNSTGINLNDLDKIFIQLMKFPSDFNVHPKIYQIYQERVKNYIIQRQEIDPKIDLRSNTYLKNTKVTGPNLKSGGLDWATCESLAFATLLYEGKSVRLSGEDVERGTFSHRHALLNDQNVDRQKFSILKNISPHITVSNSHLSEFGIMGFQYGYSITNPNCLVIWEAQFGDFANGGQVIIDNFLTSGQTKWHQQSGLVLNLPHGMDGQGPQHSSGRIERFLQASDDSSDLNFGVALDKKLEQSNIQAVYCSTAANYFHVLRRQLRREYRKPLILFNSKKLLKFRAANSKLTELQQGTNFIPVFDETDKINPVEQIRDVLICTGQFYYQLKARREQHQRKDIAIIRIQQLAPLPELEISAILSKYSNARFIWTQQEHQNQGAWSFMRPRLRNILSHTFNRKIEIYYAGRKPSAASAGGTLKGHKKEQEQIMNKIFKH